MDTIDELQSYLMDKHGRTLHQLLHTEVMVMSSTPGTLPSACVIVGFGYSGGDACVCVRYRDASIVGLVHPSRLLFGVAVPPNPHPRAELIANKVARFVFNKRGNHTEAHISELELAGIVRFGIETALKPDP